MRRQRNTQEAITGSRMRLWSGTLNKQQRQPAKLSHHLHNNMQAL
jgi:hypothetical protein